MHEGYVHCSNHAAETLDKFAHLVGLHSGRIMMIAMQEHLDLVRSNFQFVFKDIMTKDYFEENMLFSDPISKFTFFRGKCFTT